MIEDGLDYDKHYKYFNTTMIGKLEGERMALVRKIADLKSQCRHPEEHLQCLPQGSIHLFYCGTCGESFKYDARDRTADFFEKVRKAVATKQLHDKS